MSCVSFSSGDLARVAMRRLHHLGVTTSAPEWNGVGFDLHFAGWSPGDPVGRAFFRPGVAAEFVGQPGAPTPQCLPEAPECSCCKTNRPRTSTWLISKADGSFEQAGNSCFKHELDVRPHGRSVAALTAINRISALAQSQKEGRDLVDAIADAYASERVGEHSDCQHGPLDADRLRALETIRFARSLPLERSNTLSAEYQDLIDLTLADRIPTSFDFDSLARRAPELHAKLAIVDPVKDSQRSRRKLLVTFDRMEEGEAGEFGKRRTYLFATKDDQKVSWSTFKYAPHFEKGTVIEFDAPVREIPGTRGRKSSLELRLQAEHIAAAKVVAPRRDPAWAQPDTPLPAKKGLSPVDLVFRPADALAVIPEGESWLIAEARHANGDRHATFSRPGSYHVLLRCKAGQLERLADFTAENTPSAGALEVAGTPAVLPLWLSTKEADLVDLGMKSPAAPGWRKLYPEDGELLRGRGLPSPGSIPAGASVMKNPDGTVTFVGVAVGNQNPAFSPPVHMAGLLDLSRCHPGKTMDLAAADLAYEPAFG